MASVVRSTALRAGGACVRCRKGKTKCVYENGRAPCKNCAKGMHECYLPSESMSHGGHGVSPARVPQRPRESLPSDRNVGPVVGDRQGPPAPSVSRHVSSATLEKLTPELSQECERVISKTMPACVAFHKPTFLQQLRTNSMDLTMVHALLTTAARHSPTLIRRYGSQGSATTAAEHFAVKTVNLVMQSLDQPSIEDIQSLCLLVIHEWGSRNAVRAYIYLGQAARMAQMYRVVHSHHEQPDPEQFLHDESFRRTLWLIYILDCFLTSSPGRHPALSSHDVNDVSLPCLDMNYHFGSPVYVRTINGNTPSVVPDASTPLGEVGEFGQIVLATKAWRNVVEMITTTTIETFSDEQCDALEHDLDIIRQRLPIQFADKLNQINVHITMGSGYTFAMIHCLLHCATILVNRRRLLQLTTSDGFNMDAWRMSSHVHVRAVDRIFSASHSIISFMLALECGADKDAILCFPIFMLFSAFTAGSTVAWLILKGLTPANVMETGVQIVRDALRFMCDGSESWPLVMPWQRHLSVMAKVLRDSGAGGPHDSRENSRAPQHRSPSIKEDAASQPDVHLDAMQYEQSRDSASKGQTPQLDGREGEQAIPRRPGVTTINGDAAESSTPARGTPPPPAMHGKVESPDLASSAGRVAHVEPAPPVPERDMSPAELCSAFERQLLELDDLAAFMGGGV